MKLIAVVAIVLGIGILAGTRKDTPFIRWGVLFALAGVVIAFTSVLFTFGSIKIGLALALAGIAAYAFGRVVRKERLFVTRR